MSTEPIPDGYYWVKEKGRGKWIIAEKSGDFWFASGYIDYTIFEDSFWQVIDLTPIIRKPNDT